MLLRICLIASLTTISSCAAITPVASVVGATASLTGAYYDITRDENITILSKECLWYRKVKLTVEGKIALSRDDKMQIVYNNVMYDRQC